MSLVAQESEMTAAEEESVARMANEMFVLCCIVHRQGQWCLSTNWD